MGDDAGGHLFVFRFPSNNGQKPDRSSSSFELFGMQRYCCHLSAVACRLGERGNALGGVIVQHVREDGIVLQTTKKQQQNRGLMRIATVYRQVAG